MTAPLISCERATKTYGHGANAAVAVSEATCAVYPGARVGIVGRSGSGKSTLLHLMAGLEAPTGGTVSWPGLGRNPFQVPGLVGVVFQGPSLMDQLNAVENVALPIILAGQDDATAQVAAIAALRQLGLADLANNLPDELSGGQAQRVAIARVLALNPRVILADEPTGQLDHAVATHVIDVLIAAADQARAALVVTTHDRAVADRLGEKWSMSDGRLHSTSQQPAVVEGAL